jgi:dipeptidyl aminopeptidase/acylaminoacyl peptidase
VVSDLAAWASPTGEAPTDAMASSLLGYRVRDREDAARAASPISYVRADAPPFFILHGQADPLVPPAQSQAFHQTLIGAGANSHFVGVPDAIHEDAAFWSDQILSEVRAFLDHSLDRA